MSKFILPLFIALFFTACARTEGRYTVISDRPIELERLLNGSYHVAQVKAVSRRHIVVIIPFSKAPSPGDAIAAVLDKYQGDYLAGAEVKLVSKDFLFLYRYKAWEVSGTVMRLRSRHRS